MVDEDFCLSLTFTVNRCFLSYCILNYFLFCSGFVVAMGDFQHDVTHPNTFFFGPGAIGRQPNHQTLPLFESLFWTNLEWWSVRGINPKWPNIAAPFRLLYNSQFKNINIIYPTCRFSCTFTRTYVSMYISYLIKLLFFSPDRHPNHGRVGDRGKLCFNPNRGDPESSLFVDINF